MFFNIKGNQYKMHCHSWIILIIKFLIFFVTSPHLFGLTVCVVSHVTQLK